MTKICRSPVLMISLFALLSACGLVERIQGKPAPAPLVVAAAPPEGQLSVAKPLGGAQSAASFDQTTDAEKAAAVAPASGTAKDLGMVVVALGSPAEQGFWLRSSLVSAPAKGRVVTSEGQSVNVDLQPGAGAALLSLAAYRSLGIGLTELPQVQVFAD